MSNFYNYFEKNFWPFSFIVLWGASVSVLGIAFTIDRIFGYDPCFLCLYERIPYVFVALASGAGYFASEKYRVWILYFISLCALVGFGLALFHTGVEREWWAATSHCKPNVHLDASTSMDDFLSQLEIAPIGDCSKPALRIFGLSLAEINVLINLVLLGFMINLIRLNGKTKLSK